MKIPHFSSKKELFKFLVENKDDLLSQKKAAIKQGDGIVFHNTLFDEKFEVSKEMDSGMNMDTAVIFVQAIINTTNFIDSHMDLHLPKMWNRSLKESAKYILHVQEHEMMEFEKIISSGKDLKAYTKNISWRDLGYNYPGQTEALLFESVVRKDRNPEMHKQYVRGWVTNHSVGMRYVQLVMCINDKEYGAEFEAWEKYLPMAVNPEVAEEKGYFWAVTEAKIIEGSAVPRGSNVITPTLEVRAMNSDKSINYDKVLKMIDNLKL